MGELLSFSPLCVCDRITTSTCFFHLTATFLFTLVIFVLQYNLFNYRKYLPGTNEAKAKEISGAEEVNILSQRFNILCYRHTVAYLLQLMWASSDVNHITSG